MNMKKFSLIELLVVVAIIGILASLLMPSLKKSRETARRAVCLSNMKQISVGMTLFSTDNDDDLPPLMVKDADDYHSSYSWTSVPYWEIESSGINQENSYWHNFLIRQDYVEAADAYTCPSHESRGVNFFSPSGDYENKEDWYGKQLSYSPNTGGKNCESRAASSAYDANKDAVIAVNYGAKLSSTGGQTMVLGERGVHKIYEQNGLATMGSFFVTPENTARYNNFFNQDFIPTHGYKTNHGEYKVNIAYADGSAEYVSPLGDNRFNNYGEAGSGQYAGAWTAADDD